MTKIILDLCGGTGSWSKPYKDAGYDVHLVTLPNNDVRTFKPPVNVYGILAAPPCTEFSVAKNNQPRNFTVGMEIVSACLNIIWQCRQQNELKFWAVENPRGFLRQFLGLPPFEYQHWEFGTPQIKPTDIWGYFNFPRKTVKIKPDGLSVKYGAKINAKGWGRSKPPAGFEGMNLDRAAVRAITPANFSQAFFKANK